MENSDRKEVEETLSWYLDWENVSIAQIKQDLEDIESIGATGISIRVDQSFGDEYVIETFATRVRPENDEEFEKRMVREEKRRKEKEESELLQLKLLKEKYETL